VKSKQNEMDLNQMRRNKTNEFSGSYDFGFLPKSRKMLLIARDQIIRTGNIGTFQKYVVIRIVCDVKAPGRSHEMTAVSDELQQLMSKTFANSEFRAGKHLAILRKDGLRDVQSSWFVNRKYQHSALQSGRFNGSGDQHIGVDDKTEGKHYRFRT
jgi:hypothetical protein